MIRIIKDTMTERAEIFSARCIWAEKFSPDFFAINLKIFIFIIDN